jgi:hypothetical protein
MMVGDRLMVALISHSCCATPAIRAGSGSCCAVRLIVGSYLIIEIRVVAVRMLQQSGDFVEEGVVLGPDYGFSADFSFLRFLGEGVVLGPDYGLSATSAATSLHFQNVGSA